jgi:hypothetical protein
MDEMEVAKETVGDEAAGQRGNVRVCLFSCLFVCLFVCLSVYLFVYVLYCRTFLDDNHPLLP